MKQHREHRERSVAITLVVQLAGTCATAKDDDKIVEVTYTASSTRAYMATASLA